MISILNAAEVAQEGTANQILMQLLPFLLIFAIFYFLLIRPQKKRQQQHANLLAGLKAGDKVLLNSGIVGTIVKVKEDGYLILNIANNVDIEVLKVHVVSVL